MNLTYTPLRRRMLDDALAAALAPLERTMVRELCRADDPGHREPRAEDELYWIRLNMPQRARRVDAWLHPAD